MPFQSPTHGTFIIKQIHYSIPISETLQPKYLKRKIYISLFVNNYSINKTFSFIFAYQFIKMMRPKYLVYDLFPCRFNSQLFTQILLLYKEISVFDLCVITFPSSTCGPVLAASVHLS